MVDDLSEPRICVKTPRAQQMTQNGSAMAFRSSWHEAEASKGDCRNFRAFETMKSPTETTGFAISCLPFCFPSENQFSHATRSLGLDLSISLSLLAVEGDNEKSR